MIGYRLDSFKPALQPRSQAGLGKGSHSPFQLVVGRLNHPVQFADERMDSVQAGSAEGCQVSSGWDGQHIAGGSAGRRRLVGCRNRYPFPPPPHGSEWGPP